MEIIFLSSDEDELSPPVKKMKKTDNNDLKANLIVLSDEECSEDESNKNDKKDDLFIVADKCDSHEKLVEIAEEQPSCSNSSGILEKSISEFVNTCISNEKKENFKTVFLAKSKLLTNAAIQIEKDNKIALTQLLKVIEINKKTVEEDPKKIVIYFNNVFTEIKSAYQATKIESDSKTEEKIAKLYKFLMKLIKKIQEYDETEIDLDDDNSAYIQSEKYKERAVEVYKKYCKLAKLNPNKYSSRIDFSGSKCPEINRAIDKRFKRDPSFPTYWEIEKLIAKCCEDNSLQLSEMELKHEARLCFKKLGGLIQRRRKTELMDAHFSYLNNLADPASKDAKLEKILKESEGISKTRMDEICEKYTKMQDSYAELNKYESNSESSDSETESNT